jgi:uncharacterized protein YndB with AHSA1/START domain
MTSTTAVSTTHHATFTLERHVAAAPARVFHAFADVAAKQRWFGDNLDGWTQQVREMDFRVGGRERVAGTWKNGETTDFQAVYHDIVPNERIVYVYDMYHRGAKLSVSLATIEMQPDGDGTRLLITEQGAHFDGPAGAASREHGTNILIDAVVRTIED